MAPNIQQLPSSLLGAIDNKEEKQGEDVSCETWNCPASAKSLRTTNPIRAIVDPIVGASASRQHDKDFISLAVSDDLVGRKSKLASEHATEISQ